jgi:stress-induced morphogen
MRIKIRGGRDKGLLAIKKALEVYEKAHPAARIELYRQNSISVRIRVIDPAFAGLEKSERHDKIWDHLVTLPDEIQGDVSMLVVLTPEEVKRSMANLEFENPSPSLIQ